MASEHQDRVGFVVRRFEGLKKCGQSVAAAGLARRQAANEPKLRVLARVRHEHLGAVGALPPEWRTRLPPSQEGLRAAVVVGPRGEILDAGGAQHGCVAPGIGWHIGDVGVVGLAARRGVERMAGVSRADQRLQAGAARHQVGVLRRDRDAARAHGVQKLLLRRRRARAQELLRQPCAIERETHVRVAAHLFQQAIQVAVLQFLDLRLVVGEANIQVRVRNHVDRQLAFGSDAFGARIALAVDQQDGARFRAGGEFRNPELETLLAEARGGQIGVVLRAGQRQRESPARNGGRGGHGRRDQLARRTVLRDEEVRRFHGNGGIGGHLTGAQQRQRIPGDLRIAVFIGHVVHGRDAQLVVALPQRARRNRDARSGFGADRRIGASLGVVAQAAVDVRRALRAVQFEFQMRHARIAGHDGQIERISPAGRLLHPEPDGARVRLRAGVGVESARLRGRPASCGIRCVGIDFNRLAAAPAELGRGVVERPDAPDGGLLAPQRQA